MAFFLFQLGFIATATTLISGAVAERMRFAGYLAVTVLVAALLYPLFGRWAWGDANLTSQVGGSDGWLRELGFVDFAGSTVVHSMGGWVALASIILIGARIGRFGPARPRSAEATCPSRPSASSSSGWAGSASTAGASTGSRRRSLR